MKTEKAEKKMIFTKIYYSLQLFFTVGIMSVTQWDQADNSIIVTQ